MLNRNLFLKMMRTAEEFNAETDRWNSFGIEIYEMPIGNIPWTMFNCWAESNFDSDGVDWINWYLWERKSINGDRILPCYDENGVEFYVNTPSDLWPLVEPHILKPCVDSPCTFKGHCE